MLDLYVFYLFAGITIVSSLFIFIQKRLIHAVMALASAFIGSALVFFLLGQTFIGILQLIVFIGGISTYLIVAVATEEKDVKMVKIPYLIVVALITVAGMELLLEALPVQASSAVVGPSFLTAAASAFQTQYAFFYVMAVLLFSVAISGVLIMRRFLRLLI